MYERAIVGVGQNLPSVGQRLERGELPADQGQLRYMNNRNAINLGLNESQEFSGVWRCGRVRGRSVLCHLVLDNEHIHQDY